MDFELRSRLGNTWINLDNALIGQFAQRGFLYDSLDLEAAMELLFEVISAALVEDFDDGQRR